MYREVLGSFILHFAFIIDVFSQSMGKNPTPLHAWKATKSCSRSAHECSLSYFTLELRNREAEHRPLHFVCMASVCFTTISMIMAVIGRLLSLYSILGYFEHGQYWRTSWNQVFLKVWSGTTPERRAALWLLGSKSETNHGVEQSSTFAKLAPSAQRHFFSLMGLGAIPRKHSPCLEVLVCALSLNECGWHILEDCPPAHLPAHLVHESLGNSRHACCVFLTMQEFLAMIAELLICGSNHWDRNFFLLSKPTHTSICLIWSLLDH